MKCRLRCNSDCAGLNNFPLKTASPEAIALPFKALVVGLLRPRSAARSFRTTFGHLTNKTDCARLKNFTYITLTEAKSTTLPLLGFNHYPPYEIHFQTLISTRSWRSLPLSALDGKYLAGRQSTHTGATDGLFLRAHRGGSPRIFPRRSNG